MPKPRTAPLGTIRLSRTFLDSALVTQRPAASFGAELAQPISLVAYYLAGHSIELSLKAFLLGRGMSTSVLRSRRFGHDLAALLGECRKRRLGSFAKLSRTDIAIILLLNECYSAKELEYGVSGAGRLPYYSALIDLATRLQAGIAPYCGRLASGPVS